MITRRDLLAASPLALTACARSAEPYFGNTTPPKSQRLTMVLEGEPESIDPALSEGLVDFLILSLFEGLTSLHPTTGEPMAALATHYELSSDALRYRFYLRGHPAPRGAKLPTSAGLSAEYSRGRAEPPSRIPARWSDGCLLTAHDFVYSLRRALDPATAAPRSFLLDPIRNAHAVNIGKLDPSSLGVRAVDDFTLDIELEEPVHYFPELLSNRVACAVPRHVIQSAGPHWTDPRSLVSCGPFKLKSRQAYENIVIERNPLYYDAGQVALDEVTFLVPRERSLVVTLYRAGAASVADSVSPSALSVLRQKKDFHALRMYASSFIAINTSAPPFDDVRVRYALNMATNKDRARDIFGAGNIPARSVIPPGGGYQPTDSLTVRIGARDYDVLSFNPQAAREILATVGKPLPSPMEYFTSNDAEGILWAQVLRDQWKQHLGIETQIQLAEFPVWLDAITSGSFRHVAASGTSAGYIDPIWFLDLFNFRSGYGTHWNDNEYRAKVSATKRVSDPQTRAEKLKDCELHLLRAMPVIPQDYWLNATMIKPYVRGLGHNLLARIPLKYVWIDTNWRPQ